MAETNTNVTVGTTSTKVLNVSGDRDWVVITNDSDETIYLALGSYAVMNKGIRLNASGGSLEINFDCPFIGEINAICASGSKNLCVFQKI